MYNSYGTDHGAMLKTGIVTLSLLYITMSTIQCVTVFFPFSPTSHFMCFIDKEGEQSHSISGLSILTSVNGNGLHIRKTCPCNVYPLIPHIHIIRLGFTGIYLFSYF